MAILHLQPGPAAGKDTFISAGGSQHENYGVSTRLEVVGPASTSKSLIQFDLSSIPAGSEIVSAELRLVSWSSGSTPTPIGAHRSLVEWFEGNGNAGTTTINGSTWQRRNHIGSVAWAGGAGGAAGTEYVSVATHVAYINGTGTFAWDVTDDVQGFVDGDFLNRGWWLMIPGAGHPLRYFRSSDYTTVPGDRPSLYVVYNPPLASVEPDPVDAGADTTGPAIQYGTAIAPGPADSAADALVGNVENTLLVQPGPADAVTAVDGPSISYGDVASTPDPVDAAGDALWRGYALGPAPADALGDTVNPGVVIVTAIAPGPADGVGDGLDPVVVLSSVTRQPGPADARAATRFGGYALGGVAGDAAGDTFLGGLMRGPAPADALGDTIQTTFVIVRKEVVRRYPDPLLYITDGVNRFDLLSRRNGYNLCEWSPAIAQYKGGGQWSDSSQANGRRLRIRKFANVQEVMELSGEGYTQDELIRRTNELLSWLERAADFGVSEYATQPIYLVAKAAYEEFERFSLIHMGSIPELQNIFAQSFFSGRGKAVLRDITLRLERGQWTDRPPGQGTDVPVSSIRSWTVAGWQSSEGTPGDPPPVDPPPSSGPPPVGPPAAVTGDVLALVQAANGDAIAGTSDGAALYRSTNNGQSWTLITRLGSGADRVNGFARDNSGNLYAAVSGGATARGIWKSVNQGATWSKVLNHPGAGFTDVAWVRYSSTLVAVGFAVSSGSNVWVSLDGGGFWYNPSTNHSNFDIKAVAAPDSPGMPTQYPWAGGPAFAPLTPPQRYNAQYGIDADYTQVYGAGRGGAVGVWATADLVPSSQMGNGGLDMAGYAVRSNVFYQARFLWAVRSHLNTSNTELWQWPDPSQTTMPGMDRYARIAMVAGEIFNTLYVDTTPDANASQRTIWAGANGKIFVSYNSGYTWALASEAPANPVRSFVRLANGVLLVGCDNGELVVYSGDSGSSGGGESPPEQGSGTGGSGGGGGGSTVGGPVVNSQPLGRSATTAEEVYVANKTSFSNLSVILAYDGSQYSNLQYGTEPPYALLGDAPAAGNMVVFGSRTSDPSVASGPFSSLVFELTQEARDTTIVWEYWDGAAWSGLAVQDGTSGFRVLGVNSVHWIIPINWATTTVAGIEGYWVRARVTAVGANPQGPVHWPLTPGNVTRADRYIYTVNLPFVTIGADAVKGQMPALAEILWRNRADNPQGGPSMMAHRLLVGLRSLDRGRAFDAYINLSDVQVPFGVSIQAVEGEFEDALRAPTGRRYSIMYPTGNLNQWRDLVRISIDTTIARDYYGGFRAFLRAMVLPGGSGDWRFRLTTGFGSGGITSSSKTQFGTPGQLDFRLIDLGAIQIPNTSLAGRDLGDRLTLTVQGYATENDVFAKLYDLVLIPTDEWAGDFLHADFAGSGDAAAIRGTDVLDIDSIRNPKKPLNAFNRLDNGLIKSIYQPISNGEAILQAQTRQRLWFLAAQFDASTDSWGAEPAICGTVRVRKQQQYLGLRGAE